MPKARTNEQQQRIDAIFAARGSGVSISAIAREYGLSRQRVHQILNGGSYRYEQMLFNRWKEAQSKKGEG